MASINKEEECYLLRAPLEDPNIYYYYYYIIGHSLIWERGKVKILDTLHHTSQDFINSYWINHKILELYETLKTI